MPMINSKIKSLYIDNREVTDNSLNDIYVTNDVAVTFSNTPYISITHNLRNAEVSVSALSNLLFAKNNFIHKIIRLFTSTL